MFAHSKRVLLGPLTEDATGLSVSPHPLAHDLQELRKYRESRSIRLAFLSALRDTLDILPADAGQLFTKKFSGLGGPDQKKVIRELSGDDSSEDLIISFAPGMQTNNHCKWDPSLGTLDGVWMPVTLDNLTAAKIMAQSGSSQSPNAFVGKMLHKLNAFLAKEGCSFYSDSAPKMLLPDLMNASISLQFSTDTTEFSLYVALKDVGPVNVSRIHRCHLGELSDPGAGGCELRAQALADRLPQVLFPYLKRYISTLEFRVKLIAVAERFVEEHLILHNSAKLPLERKVRFNGKFPPEFSDLREALQVVKQKLNRKFSHLQIDFSDVRLKEGVEKKRVEGGLPYRAELTFKLFKK